MDSSDFRKTPEPSMSQDLPRLNPSRSESPPRKQNEIFGKERRPPSITPRKFKRFFTPIINSSRQPRSVNTNPYEKAPPALLPNATQSSPIRPSRSVGGQMDRSESFSRSLKRRKTSHMSDQSSEVAEESSDDTDVVSKSASTTVDTAHLTLLKLSQNDGGDNDKRGSFQLGSKPLPITRGPFLAIADRGLTGQLMSMRISGGPRPGRLRHTYPIPDYQAETSSFYSTPTDIYQYPPARSSNLPFSVASFNSNSLIAVGGEDGRVRIIESGLDEGLSFTQHMLNFKVHNNAIIDLEASEDDNYLVTACGDQTARVVDMRTQATLAVLGYHTASLKQARFQPGANNNHILATSGRDGSIKIWDLRTKGDKHSHHLVYAAEPGSRTDGGGRYPQYMSPSAELEKAAKERERNFARPVFAILSAHKPWNYSRPGASSDSFRSSDTSVTAIQFMPAGQEHLLLSASHSDASVRLWDIRFTAGKVRSLQQPVAVTKHPYSHIKHRHFGINSINLNTDGSRLYTLCKDNTIYAYSTAHLITGEAPELSLVTGPDSRPGPQRPTEVGLGPLHGYRHPNLRCSSFYIKSAIRKARNGKSELLAVGSTDGSPILFPTDERYLSQSKIPTHGDANEESGPKTHLTRSQAKRDDIPISNKGTALVRGHSLEVGAVAWSAAGELISIADDYQVRRWREGNEARELRLGGEGEGKRWRCGWADVDASWDEDDDI